MEIISGKRPLQGIKEFVKIDIDLDTLFSIIRVPITPTTLHPKPIAIVRACLPQDDVFLNMLSKINDIRGR